MKEITILGSTGSIGRSVLDIISASPHKFSVAGLSTCENIELLGEQVSKFNPKWVAIADEGKGEDFKKRFSGHLNEVFLGSEGIAELAEKKVDLVVVAIVGAAGTHPTLKAIRKGNNIALANKEVLVIAGKELIEEARRRRVRIFPLDSEHCAIFQMIENRKKEEVHKVILTASGGPFYNLDVSKFASIRPEEALSHPVWEMGEKITVDSATLMNKGFEVIAAKWLFDLDWDKIEVMLHPQAIVHSLVEFIDGVTLALLACPDMKGPIAYILNYPERIRGELKPTDLTKVSPLTFYAPDVKKFPSLQLAYSAGKIGGTMPAVL
ncbi:MAG TPA: 1-deoxy-D-xylulose-5-phosphate reductoisomerase, partial [Candidatus Omnitrophica bacterium]|nr:1-deoxy-D-xylulose-5-phosphate reductoisomerase [Candidatus Omnitrophota bacterium]